MNPVAEIREERERARREGDPNADVCYLATVSAAGRPEARALTLRDITARGFGLLLNRLSPKWEQIHGDGGASLLIHWQTVHRQYRVRGGFEAMEPEEVARYWGLKSRGSRLLDHYYGDYRPQSRPIASRAAFLGDIARLAARYPDGGEVPIPPTLEGIYLVPEELEAWHGSPEDRLHDRRLYRRSGSGWTFTTLVP